jgi:hypothetical protein
VASSTIHERDQQAEATAACSGCTSSYCSVVETCPPICGLVSTPAPASASNAELNLINLTEGGLTLVITFTNVVLATSAHALKDSVCGMGSCQCFILANLPGVPDVVDPISTLECD